MAGPLARRFQGPRTKSHYSPISSDLDQFNERCSRPPSRRIPAAPTPALLAHPTAYAEDFPCTLFLACGGREIRDRTLYDFSRNTNGPSAGVTDRRGSDGPPTPHVFDLNPITPLRRPLCITAKSVGRCPLWVKSGHGSAF